MRAPGRHDVVVVNNLQESLQLRSVRRLLLVHLLGYLERVLGDASHNAVAVVPVPVALIILPHNHRLLARIPPLQQHHYPARAEEALRHDWLAAGGERGARERRREAGEPSSTPASGRRTCRWPWAASRPRRGARRAAGRTPGRGGDFKKQISLNSVYCNTFTCGSELRYFGVVLSIIIGFKQTLVGIPVYKKKM